MTKTQEKREAVAKLEKLLECAGTTRPWEEISSDLWRLPIKTIHSLVYRVERARGQAFDEGREHSDGQVTASA